MKITEAILKDMILEQLLLENPTSVYNEIRLINGAENYSTLGKYYRNILSKQKYMDPTLNFLSEDFDAIANYFELFTNMTDEEIRNDINDRRKNYYRGHTTYRQNLELQKIEDFFKLEKTLGAGIRTSFEYNKKLLIAAIIYADILEGFAEQTGRSRPDQKMTLKFMSTVMNAAKETGDLGPLTDRELDLHDDILGIQKKTIVTKPDDIRKRINSMNVQSIADAYFIFYRDFFNVFLPLQRMYFSHFSRYRPGAINSVILYNKKLSKHTYLDLFYAMYNYAASKENLLDASMLKAFMNLMTVVEHFSEILEARPKTLPNTLSFSNLFGTSKTIKKAAKDFNDIFDKSYDEAPQPYDKMLSNNFVAVTQKLLEDLKQLDDENKQYAVRKNVVKQAGENAPPLFQKTMKDINADMSDFLEEKQIMNIIKEIIKEELSR